MPVSQLLHNAPEWVKAPLRRAKMKVKAIPYRGSARHCPICDNTSRVFKPFGTPTPRPDAQCPHCGSLERHRLTWFYLLEQTDLFDGRQKTMLHVAPELCFEGAFKRRLGQSYITADMYHPRAMVQMDITDIKYPDESFDVIFCSHVLEHVTDDRQAMRELQRVLKPNGWAILLVPILGDVTFEDPTITDPEDRLRVFGQRDHARIYGPDYIDRLRESGFEVKKSTMDDLVNPEQATRLGINAAAGDIFYCTKQA